MLVVDDEYIIATDLRQGLAERGATVIGPVPSVEKAIVLILSGTHLDGAILDVNLQGQMVFPVADLLLERSVPFLFMTGYDQSVIPERFKAIVRCEKPLQLEVLCRTMTGILARDT